MAAIFFLFVGSKKTVEFEGRASSSKNHILVCFNISRDSIVNGRIHLRGDKATPNKEVKFVLIDGEILTDLFWITGKIGGTNRFMSFLGCFFRCVNTWLIRKIRGAKVTLNIFASVRNSFGSNVNRVGTHVGNKTFTSFSIHINSLIETLSNAHRARN